jgi:hypothetical protein
MSSSVNVVSFTVNEWKAEKVTDGEDAVYEIKTTPSGAFSALQNITVTAQPNGGGSTANNPSHNYTTFQKQGTDKWKGKGNWFQASDNCAKTSTYVVKATFTVNGEEKSLQSNLTIDTEEINGSASMTMEFSGEPSFSITWNSNYSKSTLHVSTAAVSRQVTTFGPVINVPANSQFRALIELEENTHISLFNSVDWDWHFGKNLYLVSTLVSKFKERFGSLESAPYPFPYTNAADRAQKEILLKKKAVDDWEEVQSSYTRDETISLDNRRMAKTGIYRCKNEQAAKAQVTAQLGNMYLYSFACAYSGCNN